MNRTELILLLYESLGDRLGGISNDELFDALVGWELRLLPRNVVLLVKENEVHVAAPPKARGIWLSRRLIREQLGPILGQYGSVVTNVSEHHDQGHAFVRRMGFRSLGTGKYELKELKYA